MESQRSDRFWPTLAKRRLAIDAGRDREGGRQADAEQLGIMEELGPGV